MPQSTVPAVLTQLQATFAAAVAPLAAADSAVPCPIGPNPGSDIPADYVTVGWASDDLPSIVGGFRPTTLGNPGQVSSERYSVWCSVSTSSGDELGALRVARTDTLFQAMVAALRANRNLSGAILPPGMADVGNYQWTIEAGGQIATVAFEVVVDAAMVV